MRRHSHRYPGHWYNPNTSDGSFVLPADLPNVAGSVFQSADVALGDVAWVTGGTTPGLYQCEDATLGAAVWGRVSPIVQAGLILLPNAHQDTELFSRMLVELTRIRKHLEHVTGEDITLEDIAAEDLTGEGIT